MENIDQNQTEAEQRRAKQRGYTKTWEDKNPDLVRERNREYAKQGRERRKADVQTMKEIIALLYEQRTLLKLRLLITEAKQHGEE
jgi:hypothetical protein